MGVPVSVSVSVMAPRPWSISSSVKAAARAMPGVALAGWRGGAVGVVVLTGDKGSYSWGVGSLCGIVLLVGLGLGVLTAGL